MLGYLGDKIGLKPILVVSIVGFAVSGTCIDLVPRYKEYNRYSTALLKPVENMNNGKFILMSLEWPANYPDCSSTQVQELSLCRNATPVVNPSFYNDIRDYLFCKDASGSSIEIKSLDTAFFETPKKNNLTIQDIPANGSFCDLSENSFNRSSQDIINCEIVGNPEIGECYNTVGSHLAMFFTYLFLRMSQAIFDNTMFSLLYGTAMHLAKQHSGDISMVVVWNSVAGMFSPLIAAALVVDSDNPYGRLINFNNLIFH